MDLVHSNGVQSPSFRWLALRRGRIPPTTTPR